MTKKMIVRLAKWTATFLTACPVLGIALLAVLWETFPFPEEQIAVANDDGSVLLLDRNGGTIAWRVDRRESWRMPVNLEEVSDSLVKATVAAEDKRFWSHNGVDAIAVARATWQNLSSRRLVSGASTITMQVMRMANPKERTFTAKSTEAFRALQLERTSDKRAIMELYLNMAPYGGNTVGAEAAALRYFDKPASDLTLGEAALLAGIPQSPARFNPKRNLENALARREYVFARMLDLDFATEREIEVARREQITLTDNQPVTTAPRFPDYALRRHGGKGGIIKTTLNPNIQAAVMDSSSRHADELQEMGIEGLAVVVIDVKKSELLAMVGTAHPGNPIHGHVNCATSRRQPGSLLKPFIYAAAYSTGEITPKSLVYDIPMSWKDYKPENMDRSYLGPVTAEQALQKSRNVPAVDLLNRMSASRLAGDANSLGLDIPGSGQRSGLTLALGSTEVTLVDISNAYAALARLGEFEPLRVDSSEAHGESARVYPHGAAYLALRSLGAPDPGRPGRAVWKTGTSWNQRDAWAVAMTPDIVVGVWCGNYSGNGHPALVGARAALPLAIGIIDRISDADLETWERPDGVRVRTVCALSGQPAASACPNNAEAEYIPGVSSEAPCQMHRYVSDKGKRRLVTAWPGNVLAFMNARKKREKSIAARRPAIEITSPLDEAEYVMAPVAGPEDSLTFSCRTDKNAVPVYWFIDGELLSTIPSTKPVAWKMIPGPHELIASTAEGTSARVAFTVCRME
jgi:penicillin-binding protein 1C